VNVTVEPVAGIDDGARKRSATEATPPLRSEPNEHVRGRAGAGEQLPTLGDTETYASGNGVVDEAAGAESARWVIVFVSSFRTVAVYKT
jgi:hypothetical protein